MARLLDKPYALVSKFKEYTSEAFEEQSDELSRLQTEAEKLDDSVLEGRILKFGIADGQALYLIKKEKPLTLQHIPFFDGYALPSAHLRGLQVKDIARQVSFDIAMQKSFATKKP